MISWQSVIIFFEKESTDGANQAPSSEAVEFYNLFIHCVISRHAFMDGVQN
jgi:hypothetical protein